MRHRHPSDRGESGEGGGAVGGIGLEANQVKNMPAESIPITWLNDGRYRIDEDGDLLKRCGRCHQYYEPDTISFYASATEGDGLHPWCKSCWRARRAQRIADQRKA